MEKKQAIKIPFSATSTLTKKKKTMIIEKKKGYWETVAR